MLSALKQEHIDCNSSDFDENPSPYHITIAINEEQLCEYDKITAGFDSTAQAAGSCPIELEQSTCSTSLLSAANYQHSFSSSCHQYSPIYRDLSQIWQFFTNKIQQGKSVTAKCSICGRYVKGQIGVTSNFVTHLKRAHDVAHQAAWKSFKVCKHIGVERHVAGILPTEYDHSYIGNQMQQQSQKLQQTTVPQTGGGQKRRYSESLSNGGHQNTTNMTSSENDDPMCQADAPIEIHFQDISKAAYKIKNGVKKTPLVISNQLSRLCNMEIFIKKEFLQDTGSFKERGARNTLLELSEKDQKRGVIAASAGNHALALAYHGQQLSIPVTVVMPMHAPIMKVTQCQQYGACIEQVGRHIGESKAHALEMAHKFGMVYINGYDHPHILAGQGTVGLELLEQNDNIDAVIVPVGGGGLIAGVGCAIKYLRPDITVIGVEAERCPSLTKALEVGKPVEVKVGSTLSDGLSVPLVGYNAFATAKKYIDKMVLVKEEFIALAILRLVEMEKAVVEGAGAVGLAALLQGCLPELQGKRVVLLLCGGNIDTTILGRCLERGLAVDGRLVRFVCTVSDRAGGIAELTALLAKIGVSIKDIVHERAWLKTDIFSVRVRVTVETRDHEHTHQLEEKLKEQYEYVDFNPKEPI